MIGLGQDLKVFKKHDSIVNLNPMINYDCSDSLEVTDVVIDTIYSSISISIFSDFSFGLWYPHVSFTIDANGDTVHYGNLYYFVANSGTTWYNYFSINCYTVKKKTAIAE